MLERDINVLHLEPTDVCQAACPQCQREVSTQFNKNEKNHLTYEQITNQFSESKIYQLKKMFMCGVYGDPAAGKYTLDIYNKFRIVNPTITLGMNTNGGLRSKKWWAELAQIFNQSGDYVVFSIDGLHDTNHLYRINVNWDIMMENISTFIEYGGSAQWDMLIFRHNEHQVEKAKQLANDMGFTWFRAKVSKRPEIGTIKHPINWKLPKTHTENKISCMAFGEKLAYIDARGRSRPCCWFAYREHDDVDDLLDLKHRWESGNPHTVCKQNCSVNNGISAFKAQWKYEEQLR